MTAFLLLNADASATVIETPNDPSRRIHLFSRDLDYVPKLILKHMASSPALISLFYLESNFLKSDFYYVVWFYTNKKKKKKRVRDFPGSPVVRTLSSH